MQYPYLITTRLGAPLRRGLTWDTHTAQADCRVTESKPGRVSTKLAANGRSYITGHQAKYMRM